MTAQVDSRRAVAGALVRSCHPGPTVAVTALTALLAAAGHADLSSAATSDSVVHPAPSLMVTGLLVAAVLAGQLSIGWANDLIDADRDRDAARPDKPLAGDQVSPSVVRIAALAALAAAVALSASLGWRAAAVHLLLVVGSGWAYNLGLKASVWSWMPYAVAFGSLPAVVHLAGSGRWSWPPMWMMSVGALLGVGAHLLNVLPDLVDDERAGIRGLPHRLGAGWTRIVGPLLLLGGSVVLTLAPSGPVPGWAWVILAVCVLLAVVAWTTRGRTPFVAAIGIALVDVAGLALR